MSRPATVVKRRTRAKVEGPAFRVTDFPMHYFAAIQRQNQINLGHALRRIGVSPQAWRVLATLSDGEGRTIGYLADAAVIDRSNLGRLLESMAQEGLVERATAPDDRRVSLTRLTAAGRARFTAALPIVSSIYQRLLEGVEPAEFARLMATLRRLKRNAFTLSETLWNQS